MRDVRGGFGLGSFEADSKEFFEVDEDCVLEFEDLC